MGNERAGTALQEAISYFGRLPRRDRNEAPRHATDKSPLPALISLLEALAEGERECLVTAHGRAIEGRKPGAGNYLPRACANVDAGPVEWAIHPGRAAASWLSCRDWMVARFRQFVRRTSFRRRPCNRSNDVP